MSTHKYACFNCLQAIQRDPRDEPKVLCPHCGGECEYLGVKIPIPPKSKPKLWAELKHQLIDANQKNSDKRILENVERLHGLEKEIRKLELLPENKGRCSLIKKLRKELERLNA